MGIPALIGVDIDEESMLIEIVGQPEKVKNVEFLTKRFNAKLRLSGSNLEEANNFQKTVFNEVT